MAIGQRIRFFRKRNHLTKKQLRKKLGFQKKSHTHISRYEAETKVPEHNVIKKLAAIFNISTNALTVPNIDSDIGLMHTFFALEDMYGFKVTENDGEIYLHLGSSVSAPGSSLNTMLHAWQQQTTHLENGTISKEDYDEWRYQYSEPAPSQYTLKLPSPKVDDTSASFDETYYLVDFENVHEDGLSVSENLGCHDHIYLFSTKNAPKISIQTLTGFNDAHLYLYEIPAGNQSLDMHLVSYLGYLIGKNSNSKCKYTIVSKDTDYDNLITFWKDKNGSQITRQDKIRNTTQKIVKKNVRSKTTASKNNNKKTANSQNKTLLNTKVQQELSKAGYSNSIANKVASIVVKHYGEEKSVRNVHNELQKTCDDYSKIYNIVKPIMKQYTVTASPKTATTPEADNKIQETLNKAKFSSDIVSYVSSLVSTHNGETNAKLTIYRSIVSKYGQKQGLNIYNHVKKLI